MLGYGVAEEDAENAVLDGVRFVFVECYEDECVLHEFFVGEEGLEEGSEPDASDGYRGVVSVGGHVGGYEHPLGEFIVL